MPEPLKKYLRIDEVADILDVCGRTVRRLLQDGELKGFKVRSTFRIHQSSLDEYIRKQGALYQEEIERIYL